MSLCRRIVTQLTSIVISPSPDFIAGRKSERMIFACGNSRNSCKVFCIRRVSYLDRKVSLYRRIVTELTSTIPPPSPDFIAGCERKRIIRFSCRYSRNSRKVSCIRRVSYLDRKIPLCRRIVTELTVPIISPSPDFIAGCKRKRRIYFCSYSRNSRKVSCIRRISYLDRGHSLRSRSIPELTKIIISPGPDFTVRCESERKCVACGNSRNSCKISFPTGPPYLDRGYSIRSRSIPELTPKIRSPSPNSTVTF